MSASRSSSPVQASSLTADCRKLNLPSAQPRKMAARTKRMRLAKALLDMVSEKTGYPVEMLELTSDMEADLGIDSIKRVEIMGALRAQFPALPQADPEAFAEVRTLGDVVAYLVNRDEAQAETVQLASNWQW